MWFIVLLILVGLFLFFRSNTRRGKRFVRAYLFLYSLEEGSSAEEANSIAAQFGTKFDVGDSGMWIRAAKRFADEKFGGKQLPVINLARSKGFNG